MPALSDWLMAGGALRKAAGDQPAAAPAAPAQPVDPGYLSKQIAMNPNNLPAAAPAAPKLGPYDTKLSPEDEQKFTLWKAKNAPNDSGEDYDLRGFFKSGQDLDARGHATDLFKKPNHPTFSNLSQYHGVDGHVGGEWINHGGKSFFLPSATNLKNQSMGELQDYFTKQEPGTVLLPGAPAAPAPPPPPQSGFSPLMNFIDRVMGK